MFRFTIRDVVLLTVVVGLALGWAVDHVQIARRLERAHGWRMVAGTAEEFLRREGWKVECDGWLLSITKRGEIQTLSLVDWEPSFPPPTASDSARANGN